MMKNDFLPLTVVANVQRVTQSGSVRIVGRGNWTAKAKLRSTSIPASQLFEFAALYPLSNRGAQSTLAPMNWRRGLLLAGIHVAIAGFLVYMYEDADANFLRISSERRGVYSPLARWVDYSPFDVAVRTANLPAQVLTGWRIDSPRRWTLSGLVHPSAVVQTSSDLDVNRFVDLVFCVLIGVQWFLIGVFLTRGQLWWRHLGLLVTISVVGAACISPIYRLRLVAEFQALLPILAWLWWFLILLWKPVHLAWQSTLPRLRRLS